MLVSNEVLSHERWRGPRIVVGDFNEWTRGLTSRLMGEAFDVAKPKKVLRHGQNYPGVFPILHLDHFDYDKQLSLQSFPTPEPQSVRRIRPFAAGSRVRVGRT